jgi:hypothetical protein
MYIKKKSRAGRKSQRKYKIIYILTISDIQQCILFLVRRVLHFLADALTRLALNGRISDWNFLYFAEIAFKKSQPN